ncbi:MAG: hypothetical protein CM1200mP18_15260 [Gammaproteobacteria bacterium]|nr:MAG: hypothetical protein CM1200mP18_15260 [Gammaproteobacteria bacterium]
MAGNHYVTSCVCRYQIHIILTLTPPNSLKMRLHTQKTQPLIELYRALVQLLDR